MKHEIKGLSVAEKWFEGVAANALGLTRIKPGAYLDEVRPVGDNPDSSASKPAEPTQKQKPTLLSQRGNIFSSIVRGAIQK